ncbi:hypothetical protein Tco_0317645 [Tanacetum coccineum]
MYGGCLGVRIRSRAGLLAEFEANPIIWFEGSLKALLVIKGCWDSFVEEKNLERSMRHECDNHDLSRLYVTIVCYVLLAIVVDRGTRFIPLFVVLERDRLKALVDLSGTVLLLWIVNSERDRLIVVHFVSIDFQSELLACLKPMTLTNIMLTFKHHFQVSGLEYPEYLALSDEEVPVEDQPYAIADSPIALSPSYVADSDPEEDPEEDSEDGPVDYLADGSDGDDDDSSDDDEEEEEASEEGEAEEEEEEHLALADSVVAPVVDHVPSPKEIKLFETDESAPTSRSPQTIVPFSQTRLRRARKTVRLGPPMSPSMQAGIAEPAGGHGIDYGFIGTLDAKTRHQRAKEVGYGIRDTWVDPREAAEEIALVTLKGVNTRVTELVAIQVQDTQDIYAVIEDAKDRQTRIFQSVETLIDDKQYHYETARLLD